MRKLPVRCYEPTIHEALKEYMIISGCAVTLAVCGDEAVILLNIHGLGLFIM